MFRTVTPSLGRGSLIRGCHTEVSYPLYFSQWLLNDLNAQRYNTIGYADDDKSRQNIEPPQITKPWHKGQLIIPTGRSASPYYLLRYESWAFVFLSKTHWIELDNNGTGNKHAAGVG